MTQREKLFTKSTAMVMLVQAAAAVIQQPTEFLNWKEVEDLRKELLVTKEAMLAYLEDIDNCVCDNTPIWATQWDLAAELSKPWNDAGTKYNPDDIDIPKLAKEFHDKGLCNELAEVLATSIKYPQLG